MSALKDNHPQRCEDVCLWLDTAANKGALSIHEIIDKDHARLDIRRYSLSCAIAGLLQKSEWAGLQTANRVESLRLIGNKTSTDYLRCAVTLSEILAVFLLVSSEYTHL